MAVFKAQAIEYVIGSSPIPMLRAAQEGIDRNHHAVEIAFLQQGCKSYRGSAFPHSDITDNLDIAGGNDLAKGGVLAVPPLQILREHRIETRRDHAAEQCFRNL